MLGHFGDLDPSSFGGGAGADTRVSEAWELKQWGQEVWTALFRSLMGRERGKRGGSLRNKIKGR